MVVLIGGEKGGSGKTTLATNLAAIRTLQQGDVLLVDTDNQPTSSYWCASREERNVMPRVASIQKSGKSVRSEILQLKDKYTDIIIDAGGRDSTELRGSLLVCDKAIFPLRPSQFDIWTVSRLCELIEVAREINDKLQTYIVISQASTNPAVKEVEDMKAFLKDMNECKDLHVLNSVICERISYRRSALHGMAVTEYKPEDTKAVEEITNLYKEIYNHV